MLTTIARRLHLGRPAQRLIAALPPRAEAWAHDRYVDLAVRSGLEAPLPDGVWVPPRQLERRFGEALELLVARRGREALGDYVEFGVGGGTSLRCMHRAATALGLDRLRLFGFDSFEGLPADGDFEGTSWRPGDFSVAEEVVRARLDAEGADWDRTTLVRGWFDETLSAGAAARLGITKASVIMLDCDLYSSTVTCLAFCAPLIQEEAVVFLDDWWPENLGDRGVGQRRAFDEFLAAERDLRAEELESYYPKAAKVFLLTRSPPA